MNTVKRLVAGAGLLLLAICVFFDNALHKLRETFHVKPEPLEHGTFRLIDIEPNGSAKRAMVAVALLGTAIACLIGALVVHGAGIGHALAYLTFLCGGAGSFAASLPPNAPLPQYTFRGVYTGGSTDTSPMDFPFATYNAVFAARCNGNAPIPDVLVVQAPGTGVSALGLTCSATNLILTFTLGGGDTPAGFVATLGCFIPNTVTQK